MEWRSRAASGPLWLVAQGWIHPTDSSINVAIAQGRRRAGKPVAARGRRYRPLPRGPRGPGFPAGKDKTILVDLDGTLRRDRAAAPPARDEPRDLLGPARLGAADRTSPRTPPARAASADLRYRGYSVTEQPSSSVPERPRYTLAGTGAALARSRGLLHALRRRPGLLARGRSLRHHERRRRAAPTVSRSAGARRGCPRLHRDRGRLGQGRRLQHDVLANGAAAADPPAGRYDAAAGGSRTIRYTTGTRRTSRATIRETRPQPFRDALARGTRPDKP